MTGMGAKLLDGRRPGTSIGMHDALNMKAGCVFQDEVWRYEMGIPLSVGFKYKSIALVPTIENIQLPPSPILSSDFPLAFII